MWHKGDRVQFKHKRYGMVTGTVSHRAMGMWRVMPDPPFNAELTAGERNNGGWVVYTQNLRRLEPAAPTAA